MNTQRKMDLNVCSNRLYGLTVTSHKKQILNGITLMVEKLIILEKDPMVIFTNGNIQPLGATKFLVSYESQPLSHEL